MSARQKLNRSYFNGSLLLAIAAGCLTNSWLVFLVALAILLLLNIYTEEIRLRSRNPNPPSSIDPNSHSGDTT